MDIEWPHGDLAAAEAATRNGDWSCDVACTACAHGDNNKDGCVPIIVGGDGDDGDGDGDDGDGDGDDFDASFASAAEPKCAACVVEKVTDKYYLKKSMTTRPVKHILAT